MHSILHFHALLLSKLSFFLAFSFFVSGCHTGNEPVPVPEITAKKEHKRPETSDKKNASGILLSGKPRNKSENNLIYSSSSNAKTNTGVNRRDPFALPEALRKQQPVTSVQQNYSNQMQQNQVQRCPARQQTPLDPQEPCLAGIFNMGTEYYALIRWQQVQGIFGCGENLGNGYYLKEITATSVLLFPEQSHNSTNSITLILH